MPSSTQAILNSAWIHTFAFAECPNSRAPIHVFWTLLQKKRNKTTGTEAEGTDIQGYLRMKQTGG